MARYIQGSSRRLSRSACWEEITAELDAGKRERARIPRTKQSALLAGLLFCTSCKRPMIATYTAKRGRRYHYYVCQAARQNGWDSCPTKSLPAAMIEESVVTQLRAALSADAPRERLDILENNWQLFEQGDPHGLVRSVVEEIGYDGATGAVSLKLGTNQAER